ncbi:unnamed protein product [Nezara viridula]|uniref:Neprilysin-2 n=1 Tax=Nezara viridula TaxID=85310 RepID=A0A9P0EHJ8_NEZVI|nr:unnamed protein product [Nezara viridula]
MTHPASTTVIKNPTWWRRRTQLERVLTLITVATIGLCVILTIALALTSYRQYHESEALPTMSSSIDADGNATKNSIYPKKPDSKICLSDGCIHTASMLLKSMDLEASPCDDFYQFACGKFRKKMIPDDKSSLSTFSVISDDLQLQLRSILEEKIMPGELRPITYAKTLYGICMNKSRIEANGEEGVRQLLKTLGGWPVLEGDSWEDGMFDWRETVYKFRNAGLSVDYIIDFSVSVDYKNTTYRIIDLDQGSLSLNREFFIKGLENRLVSAYAKYMVDMAILMGAEPERAKKEMSMALDFEMLLANISLPMEKKRNATLLYNKMTVRELQAKFPSIPWRDYISKILPAKISIDEDEPVIVEVPSYITSLEKILEQTPKRVVANYMLWRAASSVVSYMPEKFRNRQLEYYTAVSGSTEREARWKECVDHASSSLSLAVGSLYIQKYFDEEAKKNALDLVRRIREEMYKILEAVEWMDDETREHALTKAKAMTEHIAYPDELLENDKLEKFYSGYEITDGDFLEAVLNTTKFAFEFNFGRLRDLVNKTEWFSHGRPTIVNAYYNSIENSIQFPAGILQGIFFSNKRPSYMNYGAIGFVIGHEITHGFDDQGRQFDANGNLVDWWAPETKDKYLEKAKCIIDQYGNYTDSQVNMKLNGINTQGENIADNGGIKEAYKAYLAWVEENGEEPRLPGFQDYTPQQMFWISAASVWCSVYRNETLSNRITTGYHSPGEFRVRGPLSNRPEFAEDFACPAGSPMNPVKKCQIW